MADGRAGGEQALRLWARKLRPAKALRGAGSNGGDEGTRTPDPLHAKQVLYQLSYIPTGPAKNSTIR